MNVSQKFSELASQIFGILENLMDFDRFMKPTSQLHAAKQWFWVIFMRKPGVYAMSFICRSTLPAYRLYNIQNKALGSRLQQLFI